MSIKAKALLTDNHVHQPDDQGLTHLGNLLHGLDALVHSLPVVLLWPVAFPFHLKCCILQSYACVSCLHQLVLVRWPMQGLRLTVYSSTIQSVDVTIKQPFNLSEVR